MAILSKQELKGMRAEEMNTKVRELRKELVKHNAQISTGTPPKSPGLVREIKKTIARLQTRINNMEKKDINE